MDTSIFRKVLSARTFPRVVSYSDAKGCMSSKGNIIPFATLFSLLSRSRLERQVEASYPSESSYCKENLFPDKSDIATERCRVFGQIQFSLDPSAFLFTVARTGYGLGKKEYSV